MEINITLLNGQSHLLKVDLGITVGSLKALIFDRFKVSESQRLLYDNDGQRLILADTSKSLRDYGLPLCCNICVLVTEPTEPAEAQVFLKTEKGQLHTYTVSPGETVGNFKRKVQEKEGVAEDQQRLIHEEAIFVMEINITLLNGQSHPLTVDPGTTVCSLKTLIFDRFKVSESQRLLYDNDGQRLILADTSKSLRDYGLPLCANICVLVTEPTEPAEAQVFLKTETGQLHTYTVSPGETVGNFKRKVRQREGVAEDQQRLIHEGKQMDDDSCTLESYHVREQSTIPDRTVERRLALI